MDKKTLIKNCLAYIDDNDTQKIIKTDILINKDIIEGVERNIDNKDSMNVIDGSSLFVVPGLINGHQHSHEHYQKGRIENLPLEMWMHYVRTLNKLALSPRQIYLRTLIGAIEALKTGCTTIVDDASIAYPFDVSEHNAIHKAYQDIGLRALIGFAMMDKPLIESFPFTELMSKSNMKRLEQEKRPDATEYISLMKDCIGKWHNDKNRISLIVSPSAPQRCTDDFLMQLREFADNNKLPIITHVQETRMQVVTGNKFYKKTIIEHLNHINFLDDKTSLIHAVWLNKREISILRKTGTSVQHNPWSNLMLGSGIQPVNELIKAGVNVTMGSDGSCSTHTISMLNVLGIAGGISKIRDRHPQNWLSANQVFDLATKNAAKAIGMENKIGKIKVGYKADICGYSTNSITFTPLSDPILQLVNAERGSALKLTIIDGVVVIKDGSLVKINENNILEEIREEFKKIEPRLTAYEHDMDNIVKDFKKIYKRSEDCKISKTTFRSTLTQ